MTAPLADHPQACRVSLPATDAAADEEILVRAGRAGAHAVRRLEPAGRLEAGRDDQVRRRADLCRPSRRLRTALLFPSGHPVQARARPPPGHLPSRVRRLAILPPPAHPWRPRVLALSAMTARHLCADVLDRTDVSLHEFSSWPFSRAAVFYQRRILARVTGQLPQSAPLRGAIASSEKRGRTYALRAEVYNSVKMKKKKKKHRAGRTARCKIAQHTRKICTSMAAI